jgi:hypothetical protein
MALYPLVGAIDSYKVYLMRPILLLLLSIFLFSCKENAIPLHTPYLRGMDKQPKFLKFEQEKLEADMIFSKKRSC